jgi:hypothetical protein
VRAVLCDRCETPIESTQITTTLEPVHVVLANTPLGDARESRAMAVRITVEPVRASADVTPTSRPDHDLCPACFKAVAIAALNGRTRLEQSPGVEAPR